MFFNIACVTSEISKNEFNIMNNDINDIFDSNYVFDSNFISKMKLFKYIKDFVNNEFKNINDTSKRRDRPEYPKTTMLKLLICAPIDKCFSGTKISKTM